MGRFSSSIQLEYRLIPDHRNHSRARVVLPVLFLICSMCGIYRIGQAREVLPGSTSIAERLEEVKKLIKDGRYSDAESMARDLQAEAEKRHGTDSG